MCAYLLRLRLAGLQIRHSLIGSECLDALKNEIYHYCKLFPECLDASLRREAIDAMPADLVKAMLLESKMVCHWWSTNMQVTVG